MVLRTSAALIELAVFAFLALSNRSGREGRRELPLLSPWLDVVIPLSSPLVGGNMSGMAVFSAGKAGEEDKGDRGAGDATESELCPETGGLGSAAAVLLSLGGGGSIAR